MKVRTISLTGVGFPPGQINLELIYAVHARITLSKNQFSKAGKRGEGEGQSIKEFRQPKHLDQLFTCTFIQTRLKRSVAINYN